MAWIESHQELARHPKTRRLARELEISVPAAIGHLHLLWWWALDYASDGDLTRYTDEDLADAALWEGSPDVLRAALVEAGFVDADGLIHDWDDYRHGYVARRERSALRRAWESIAYRVRPVVLQRDGYRCRQCGSAERLEVDHVIPIARGGSNDPDNLRALCRPCNRRKGAG